jgi:hypothetical protein
MYMSVVDTRHGVLLIRARLTVGSTVGPIPHFRPMSNFIPSVLNPKFRLRATMTPFASLVLFPLSLSLRRPLRGSTACDSSKAARDVL